MSKAGVKAIVLAGDRGPDDPLARAAGVPCKAVIPLDGRLMILRVVDALRTAGIEDILLCGPRREVIESHEELSELLTEPGIRWIDFAPTPCTSAMAALDAVGMEGPVLLTTADHGFPKPEVFRAFLEDGMAAEGDLAFGAARHADVVAAFPGVRRTAHRLRGDAWCGCNLFLSKSPRARDAVAYWRRVEEQRKRPWKQAQIVGWGFLAMYAARRLSLHDAARRIGRRMGVTVAPIRVHDPEAAVDVDSTADWKFVAALLEDAARSDCSREPAKASPGDLP